MNSDHAAHSPGQPTPDPGQAGPGAAALEDARTRLAPLAGLFPVEARGMLVPSPLGPRTMHYVDEGQGNAAPVLCVHGNPTWCFYWRAIVAALKGEARVVAPDHLGMGLSDRIPGGMRLADHVAALVALIDRLDLDDITLVVHDWGGAIGFGAALQRPQRFSRFVVTNTAAFPFGLIPKRIAACRAPLFGRLAVQGGNAFARAATQQTTVVPLPKRVKEGLLAPYDSWSRREQIWRFVEDIPMNEKHPSWSTLCGIADRLETLRGLPIEIVWGMRDWCFSPQFLAVWKERFPDAAVSELGGAGHYVNEDAPETVISAIRRIRRVSVADGPDSGARAEVSAP